MRITFDTLGKLLTDFPDLKYLDKAGKKEVSWKVKIFANFVEEKNYYKIYPPFSEWCSLKWIFSIYVNFSCPNPYREVYEKSGRIYQLSKDRNKSLLDLHSKSSILGENICISWYFEEQDNIWIHDFFLKYVLQFLCDILYYKKFWKLFPRGENKHWVEWLFQWFLNVDPTEDILRKLIIELEHMAPKQYNYFYKPLFLNIKKIDSCKSMLTYAEYNVIFLVQRLLFKYNIKL